MSPKTNSRMRIFENIRKATYILYVCRGGRANAKCVGGRASHIDQGHRCRFL